MCVCLRLRIGIVAGNDAAERVGLPGATCAAARGEGEGEGADGVAVRDSNRPIMDGVRNFVNIAAVTCQVCEHADNVLRMRCRGWTYCGSDSASIREEDVLKAGLSERADEMRSHLLECVL